MKETFSEEQFEEPSPPRTTPNPTMIVVVAAPKVVAPEDTATGIVNSDNNEAVASQPDFVIHTTKDKD